MWNTIDAHIRYSVPEELKEGSVVGNLAKELGMGLSEITDRKLRIASETVKQYFKVDLEKGEIADINDNSPSFLTNERILKIAESTATGVRFPLESAVDPDVGSNSLKSYTLSKDECFGVKVKNLDDGRKVPELALEKPLDREKQAVHHLVLTAVDGGNPARSGTSQITVIVLDINDNIPVFEKSVYKIVISEDSVKGTPLIRLLATDLDEGANGEILYSFGEHMSNSVNSIFHIDSNTGEMFLKGELDYESAATYRIEVVATDKGSPEMEGHCSV
ncbi:protocadherin gamma-C5-like, partial [Scleropages formosus]